MYTWQKKTPGCNERGNNSTKYKGVSAIIILVSCRLLANVKMSNLFSYISWREQDTFRSDGKNVRFVLDQHTKLDFYIVLGQWNNGPRVDMSLHPHILSWFRANQSLILFLNNVCLVEKQQIPILYSLVWSDPNGARTHDLPALEANTLNITLPVRLV